MDWIAGVIPKAASTYLPLFDSMFYVLRSGAIQIPRQSTVSKIGVISGVSPRSALSHKHLRSRSDAFHLIPFEEFGSLNDAFDYYRDHREKSVKRITTARLV